MPFTPHLMAAPDSLILCWNGQVLGRVTEFETADWPWVSGDFAATDWPADLREVAEWFARQADADVLTDPPFSQELLSGWSVSEPNGSVRQIAVPLIDFAARTIEWR